MSVVGDNHLDEWNTGNYAAWELCVGG